MKITLQPQNTNLCPALTSTASISVATTAVSPTYVWEYWGVAPGNSNPAWVTITGFNAGAVYSNYTTGTLGITRATIALPLMGTEYRVTVSQGSCSITSSVAKLTISSAATAGTITQSATSVCTGNTITFTLSGSIGTSIQWESSPTNLSGSWAPISGETNTTYTTGALTTSSNRYYRAVVSNTCTSISATTATKTITVSPLAVAGTITTGGGIVCINGTGTQLFLMTVYGNTGTIQWQYSTNAGNTWTNAITGFPLGTNTGPFSGSTFMSEKSANQYYYAIYNITGTTSFRALITNGACTAITNVVTYTLASAIAGNLITSVGTLCSATGTGATLSLTGSVGTAIQWWKSIDSGTNWTASSVVLPLGTSPTLSTGQLTITTWYKAVVSVGTVGTSCTADSNIVVVAVDAKPVAGTISGSITICSGSNATLTLNNSTGSIVWTSSTTSGGTYLPVTSGTGNGTVSYNTGALSATTYYKATLTSGVCGSLTTAVATVIVRNPISGVVSSSTGTVASPICYYNTGVTLSLTGNSGGTISWQQFNGSNWIPVSGTTATLATGSLTATTNFRAIVTAFTGCSQTSSPWTVFVNPALVVATVTGNQQLCAPNTGTVLTAPPGYASYQWQRATVAVTTTGGQTVSAIYANVSTTVPPSNGFNTATYATGALTVTTAYRIKVTDSAGCIGYSAAYIVTVLKAGTVTGDNTSATPVCASLVTKLLTLTFFQGTSYQWQSSTTSATTGFANIAGTTTTYAAPLTNPSPTWYRVLVNSTGSCAAVATVGVPVYVNTGCRIGSAIPNADTPVVSNFDVKVSPNPYTENFNLSLSTSSEENVGIIVYDMIGRLIEQREVKPSEVDGHQIGNGYPSGVYNILVSQGTEVKTLRVIKR